MMREYTVVRQLRNAAYDISPIVKTTLDIYYRHNDGAARWVSSNRMSKDDMVSILFDLSLLGYYVNLVRTVKFSFEYSIQMYLHPSGNMRTNIGSSLMEQIAKMIDKVQRNGK